MASKNLEYLKSKRKKSARAFNAMAHAFTDEQIKQHYIQMAQLDCQIAQLDPTLKVEKRLDEDGTEHIFIESN